MAIFPKTNTDQVSSRKLPQTSMNPLFCICRQTTTKECPYVRANTRVNWVGCDGPLCARWFHLHCVGLLDRNFAQVGKSKFLCPICSASWETCSFLSRLFLKKQDLRFVISPLTYSNVSLQFMSIMQGILLSYHLLQSRFSFIYDLFFIPSSLSIDAIHSYLDAWRNWWVNCVQWDRKLCSRWHHLHCVGILDLTSVMLSNDLFSAQITVHPEFHHSINYALSIRI